jgi:ElaB/YqjD/DUF883 family membrane-anchored ribosome-binding protein
LLEDSTMAKATGRAQGRSGPPAQGRERQGKQNPEPGRGGGGGPRNGTAGGRRNEQGRSQRRSRGQSGRSQPGEEQEQSGLVGRIGGAGKAIGGTVKEHPMTSAAVGAGVALLAAQGLRMALGGLNSSRDASDEGEEDSGQAEDSTSEEQDEGSGEEGQEDEGEVGGGWMGRLRGGASRLGSVFGGSAQAIKRGAQSGFGRGREAAGQSWATHPLMLCGMALAVGAGVGMLLPSTRQEDRLMGKSADKVTGRIRKGGQEFFRQGRQIAGKVVSTAVSATSKEAEREGLTPDRIGKKVKRLVNHVRDAVSEAIEE